MKKRTPSHHAVRDLEAKMDHGLHELSEQCVRYPFRWFPQGKVARLCGFGEDVMALLAGLGAPIVARKCNPHLLQRWLELNIEKVGKVRAVK